MGADRKITFVLGLVAVAAVGVAIAAGRAGGPSGSAPRIAGGGVSATVDPGAVYDPIRAGETLPAGYRPLLGRDQIPPVYDPMFVSAADAGWDPETLVIGVAGEREAKAYPVGFLDRREMVIDSLDGAPILVSW